jgi:hypothetical protein
MGVVPEVTESLVEKDLLFYLAVVVSQDQENLRIVIAKLFPQSAKSPGQVVADEKLVRICPPGRREKIASKENR